MQDGKAYADRQAALKKNQRISKERRKDLKFNPVYMVCAGTCGHVVQLREKRKPQDAQDGKRKPDRKGGEFEWPPQAEHKKERKENGVMADLILRVSAANTA
jgi:hypothetical protein